MVFINLLKKYYQTAIGITVFWILSFPASAQNHKDQLRLLATYQLWLSGNNHGYMVSRTLILKDGELIDNPVPELLTEKPLKPAPLEMWEQPAEHNDYAGVAAQAIYGDDFEVEAGDGAGMVDILNRATEQESKLGFALLAADISPQVAKLSGLWFTDSDVRPGEKYLY